jgi:predicted DNA-binding ribbon-helix-helix protein
MAASGLAQRWRDANGRRCGRLVKCPLKTIANGDSGAPPQQPWIFVATREAIGMHTILISIKANTTAFVHMVHRVVGDDFSSAAKRGRGLGATMNTANIKRSIVRNGQKTSVSLEKEFWEGLREIASTQKTKLTTLVQQIDQKRDGTNLSSAIRVFVFNHLRAQVVGAQDCQAAMPRPTESAFSS